DHMRQSERGLPIYAFAEAYRVTKSVVFCRGIAWQTDKNVLLAQATGTFMRMGLTNVPWKLKGSL
ncbi:MAG TPA: thioesterase, partial [Pseudomonadales bacterium]|nr:thioesterase [Pseudomonadales bacterium]